MYRYVYNNNRKKALNLKEGREGDMGGLEGEKEKGGGVIIL